MTLSPKRWAFGEFFAISARDAHFNTELRRNSPGALGFTKEKISIKLIFSK